MTKEPHCIEAIGLGSRNIFMGPVKARRGSKTGQMIKIESDDRTFEAEGRKWCETTGNHINKQSENYEKVSEIRHIS